MHIVDTQMFISGSVDFPFPSAAQYTDIGTNSSYESTFVSM